MKYYLKTMEKEVIINNSISEISHITNFINELGNSLQMLPVDIMNISLALEEAIVNVIKYAYPTEGGNEIRLKVAILPDAITFMLIDNGTPLTTASMDEMWETLSLDKLGFCLIRKIMDEVTYVNVDGKNLLTMVKRMDIEIKAIKTLRTTVYKIEGITIIAVEGRLDTYNTQEFDTIIHPFLTDTSINILINCENLSYISSSGIRSLILLQKNVAKNHGRMALEAMKPEVRKIFEMTGCTSLFTIR